MVSSLPTQAAWMGRIIYLRTRYKIQAAATYNVTAALPFPVKRCYPTFAIRIIIGKTGYLTTNSRQPKATAKWSLTGCETASFVNDDPYCKCGIAPFVRKRQSSSHIISGSSRDPVSGPNIDDPPHSHAAWVVGGGGDSGERRRRSSHWLSCGFDLPYAALV